jgi:serine O-acetyltransferase
MMIKELYNSIRLHLEETATLRKHGGIWGLKAYLAKTETPDRRLLAIYDDYFKKKGSWIGFNSRFDGLPCFPHGPLGIFISGGAKLGRNAVIFPQVTIGSNTLNNSDKSGSPTIGNNVYIGAGAKIIGNITIGDNCRIGANAVVYKDMPPHCVAVQSQTRVIQKVNLDNRYYSYRGGTWVYYNDGAWIEDTSKKI